MKIKKKKEIKMKFKREKTTVHVISEGDRKAREIVSSTVEANLLYEILQELRKGNKPVKVKKVKE